MKHTSKICITHRCNANVKWYLSFSWLFHPFHPFVHSSSVQIEANSVGRQLCCCCCCCWCWIYFDLFVCCCHWVALMIAHINEYTHGFCLLENTAHAVCTCCQCRKETKYVCARALEKLRKNLKIANDPRIAQGIKYNQLYFHTKLMFACILQSRTIRLLKCLRCFFFVLFSHYCHIALARTDKERNKQHMN